MNNLTKINQKTSNQKPNTYTKNTSISRRSLHANSSQKKAFYDRNVVLKIHKITKIFTNAFGIKKTVVKDFSMNIEEGKMYGIIGPSGSGKSTILQIASLLNKPTRGEVLLSKSIYNSYNNSLDSDNHYINLNKLNDDLQSKIRNKVFGFIYQFHYLMSDFSVLENITMPGMINNDVQDNYDVQKHAIDILKTFNMLQKKDNFPFMLSGGERQRAAIARAIINKPKVLFADEPTGNLDEYNENIVYDFLRALVKQTGMSCIIATHSKNLISKMDEIIEL